MGDAGTDARPEAGPVTGASPAGDQEPGTRRSGTGRKARVAAMRTADTLRERGIAAAALFKLSMGGWIVRVYPGGIRRRTGHEEQAGCRVR